MEIKSDTNLFLVRAVEQFDPQLAGLCDIKNADSAASSANFVKREVRVQIGSINVPARDDLE